MHGYHSLSRQQAIDLATLILRAKIRNDKPVSLNQLATIIPELVPRDMLKAYSCAEWKKVHFRIFIYIFENYLRINFPIKIPIHL